VSVDLQTHPAPAPDTPSVPAPPGPTMPGPAGAVASPPDPASEHPESQAPTSAIRTAAVAALAASGAAVTVGGLFQGALARPVGVLAAVVGAGLVALAIRAGRTWLQYLVAPAVFVAGYLVALVLPNPTGVKGTVVALVHQAISNGGLSRPPIPFDPGWRFLLVTLIGLLAAAGVSLGHAFHKPRLAVLIPLPLVLGGSLNQPHGSQVVTGAVTLALMLVALTVGYGAEIARGGELARVFEIRQLARSGAATLLCLTVLVLLSHAGFLFPKPSPRGAQPQKPKVVPLSQIPEHLLFTVRSTSPGPWRLGVLDTYQKDNWLLPPYDPSRALNLPASGDVPGGTGAPSQTATFTIANLGGLTLPSAAEPQQVSGHVSLIRFDPRTGVFRARGAVPDGFAYTVRFAVAPSGNQLSAAADQRVAASLNAYLQAPAPPSAVAALLASAPKNRWERLEFLRNQLYDHVVAAGSGVPAAVPPSSVVRMLHGGDATPYQIVAAEALLARWAGLPSRIGFGFYGGTRSGGVIAFRPRDGANWLEVHFPGYGWVPILGHPLHARSDLTSQPHQPVRNIVPSSQLTLQIYVPVINVDNQLPFEIVRFYLVRILGVALLAFAAWLMLPSAARALRRRRRRAWAQSHGPAGRIAVAYAEFRDRARDLRLDDGLATPLEFLELVVADVEHSELAWLTTRALWGDLARDLRDEDASSAEEMSRSLSRRVARAQPEMSRLSAFTGRASLRAPWDPGLPNPWPQPGWMSRLLARTAGYAIRVPRRVLARRPSAQPHRAGAG
jgi:hypothetical protein